MTNGKVPLTRSRQEAIAIARKTILRQNEIIRRQREMLPPQENLMERKPQSVAPSTMVSDTLRTQETARVGNVIAVSETATAIYESVNGYEYLKDLKPPETQSEVVSLDTEPIFSSACTLCMSYTYNRTEEEVFKTGEGDGDEVTVNIREHKVLVRFGVSASPHVVEVDVCEGGVVTIPAASAGVSVLDYTHSRAHFGGAEGKGLKSQAHMSSGTGVAAPAVYTERVYAPYQVAVDPLDPPTIEQHLENLKRAVCNRSYVTVVP